MVHEWQAFQSLAYTGTGTGVAVDISKTPVRKFTLQVSGTGGVPTAFDVVMQCSLDGVKWTNLLNNTEATPGDGGLSSTGIPVPVKFLRSQVDSLTLGPASNIVVSFLGVE